MGAVVLLAAAMYRPLSFWAANAWDLSNPFTPLAVGGTLFVVGVTVAASLAVLTHLAVLGCALATALGLLLGMTWSTLDNTTLAFLLLGIFTWLVFAIRPSARMSLAILFGAVFGLAPIVDVVVSHSVNSTPYPVGDRTGFIPVSPTGSVDDILLVIVDGYPTPTVAQHLFRHDSSQLTETLNQLGYQVVDPAWSQHMFTGLSIPSMLELRPLGIPEPAVYGHRRSSFDIMRGDSLLANSARSAGFTYHHVESGWDGDSCGAVDHCLRGPIVNETAFRMFDTSAIRQLLYQSYGSFAAWGTFSTVENLASLEQEFRDDDRDFVYAHLLLPHDPYIVDAECTIRPSVGSEESRVSSQLTCVNRLLESIARLAQPRTAVVITGDHGSYTNGQRSKPAEQWTDSDIGETFSILLAYRFPDDCAAPSAPTNLATVRAQAKCALSLQLPPNHGRFMIGADDPAWIAESRIASIQQYWLSAAGNP